MPLSSQQRAEWASCINNWRNAWGQELPSEKEWVIAVADHLTACESLLREIGATRWPEFASVDLDIWGVWQARIASLLGDSDATE